MYLNNSGHMTKMAVMPIYGKTLQKSFSPELVYRFQRNFQRSTDDSSATMYMGQDLIKGVLWQKNQN